MKKFQKKKGQRKARVAQTKRGRLPLKVLLYSAGAVALGGGAYLLYDYVRNKSVSVYNNTQETPDIIINNNLPIATSTSQQALATRSDNFPLKRGSKGERVTQLQQALANMIGKEAMNANGGIDGKFGSGTENALKIAGYSSAVSENVFQAIVTKANAVGSTLNAKALAQDLYRAAQARDLQSVVTLLMQMKNVSDYSVVNEYYKAIPIISKTIVNDLLNYVFSKDQTAKEQIKNEFLRMGLKVNALGVWSLQGIRLYHDLVTVRPTVVTDAHAHKIAVPLNTILGEEIKVASGMTWFKSVDNGILQVPTQDVKYFN